MYNKLVVFSVLVTFDVDVYL